MPDDVKKSITRRRVLTGAAVGGAAVAASPLLGGTAGATTTSPETTQADLARQNISHVVLLMMENRSFDHLFGTLSGVRGFDDRSITRPDGKTIFAQYDAVTGRDEYPYHLPFVSGAQGEADLSHNWAPQHNSLNATTHADGSVIGSNDNWIAAHRASDGAAGPYTMGYLTRADAPYHYALADTFTICDNYFCSVLGPTYPNRLMWEIGSLDAAALGGGPLITTDESVFTGNAGLGVFDYPTFPERLTAAGVSWKAYTEPASNHLLNMFPAFTQYNVKVPAANTTPGQAAANLTNYTSGTLGTSTGGFLADVAAGTLPKVSWIFPTPQSTEHPGEGSVNGGPEFYEPIITALMASKSWANTVLLITYDENDGYFDHVPPPQAPAGTPGEYLQGPAFGASGCATDPTTGKTTCASDPSYGNAGPVGLGFRVPNLVISPWSRGGRVNSDLFDHTSCLKLVETIWGVSPRGIVSDWRYDLVGDLTTTMDFASPDTTAAPAALHAAFVASQLLMVNPATPDETVPAAGTGSVPRQETTPARPRVGGRPSFTQETPPAAALAEVGSPTVLLGVGIAAAMGVVAANRIRSGGASDSTRAGWHLVPAAGEDAETTQA